MNQYFYNVKLENNSTIQFYFYEWDQFIHLMNIPGVVVILKNDFYGYHQKYKIENANIGEALQKITISNFLPKEFGSTYYFAFFECYDSIKRHQLFNSLIGDSPKL